MRARRTVPLLLLLLTVGSGLFAMHTFGHAGPRPAATHEATAMAAMPEAGVGLSAGQPAAASILASGGTSPGMPMDPAAVCLAILCALTAIVAALMMLAGLRAGAGRLPMMASIVGIAGRGPPRAGVGLRIAELSVLRN